MKSEKGKLWYMVSLNLYHIFENSILLKFGYLPISQIDKLTNAEIEDIPDDDLRLTKSLDILIFMFFESEEEDVKMYVVMEILHLVTKMKNLELRLVSLKVLLSKIDGFKSYAENNKNIHEIFKKKFITYLNEFHEKYQFTV
jgi:hypothetical protein